MPALPDLAPLGPALLAGDFDPMLRLYAEKVAVFLPGAVYCLAGEDEIRAALAEHRAGALREGAVALRAGIAALGLPRGGRGRLIVDWHYDFGPAGFGRVRPARQARATYFVAETRRGPRIELIDYGRLAFRQARRWHSGRALVPPAAGAPARLCA